MKTGAIIQARTSSTRLPGKVLKELPYGSGITVLGQVIKRSKRARRIDEIIVATTKEKEDDEIIGTAKEEDVKYFRGSKEDVLSRYYLSAREYDLDVIVRITSDCPCMDPHIVDLIIEKHIQSGVDYTSNTLKRTYPHGLDVEVFSFNALKKSSNEAKEVFEREHVTPYMYSSGKFKTRTIDAPQGLMAPDIRITLDTKEDYALLCAVFDFLYPGSPFFGAKEVVELFGRRPWLKYINEKVAHKAVFDSLEQELREAIHVLDLQDLKRARDYISEGLKRQK